MAPVMLELWGKQITPSLPSLPGQIWPEVVAYYRVLSMGQIEFFVIQTKCKQRTYAQMNCLKENCLIIQLCVDKWLMFKWIISVK